MRALTGHRHLFLALLIGVATALSVPVASQAATLHPQLLSLAGYGGTPIGYARTADGVLHVVIDQNTNWGSSYNGIAALTINPAGHVGPSVQALNWGGQASQGIPGLTVMPSGALEATWGGYPFGSDGPWGISSGNGGATWSSPVNIGSGSMEFGDSHVAAAISNGTPVLAAGCCGGIVIQQGFGAGAPTYQLTNSTDGCAGNTNLVEDAATGAAIASWDSCDGTGGLWLQQTAPFQGAAQKAPIPSQYGEGIPLMLANRTAGPGVFAAYPSTYANTTHISLLRYGGGSVSVGSARHLHADVWGAATGNDGRIWVFWWGGNTKNGKQQIAFTRSNNADSAFEPIQTFNLTFSIGTLSGDGRLGPLDLLISGLAPNAQHTGIYYAHIYPALSASVHVADLGGGKFKLKVGVTDAGDPVSGATVTAKGKSKTTNGKGHAKLKVSGSSGDHVTVTVFAPGYRTLKETVKL